MSTDSISNCLKYEFFNLERFKKDYRDLERLRRKKRKSSIKSRLGYTKLNKKRAALKKKRRKISSVSKRKNRS